MEICFQFTETIEAIVMKISLKNLYSYPVQSKVYFKIVNSSN